MSNKLFCLIAIVLLALTGAGQAAEWVDWTGLGGDRDWNNGANWCVACGGLCIDCLPQA